MTVVPKCCKCGRNTYTGSAWNGVTDRVYCIRCARTYFFDGDDSSDEVEE